MPEVNPSGKKVIYLPLPGGQMRFHITWDDETQLFWLLSTQTTGETEKESRHYASMEIDGDDLVLVSRSGSPNAYSPHNVDLITFHRIKNFRSLIY